jgi:hypothetical protein
MQCAGVACSAIVFVTLTAYLHSCLSVCVCLPTDLQAVVAATAELVAQVQAHQATAARLSSLAVQCGGAPVVLDELEALAGELFFAGYLASNLLVDRSKH